MVQFGCLFLSSSDSNCSDKLVQCHPSLNDVLHSLLMSKFESLQQAGLWIILQLSDAGELACVLQNTPLETAIIY